MENVIGLGKENLTFAASQRKDYLLSSKHNAARRTAASGGSCAGICRKERPDGAAANQEPCQ
jgi:hypothetical protein